MNQITRLGPNKPGHDQRLLEGLISRVPLFQQVARTRLANIASRSHIHHLRRGSVLYRRGDSVAGVIAVGYGVIQLVRRRPDGGSKVIKFVTAHQACGECAEMLDRPWPVDVVALEDSMIAVIPAAPLHLLIARDPCFADNIVRAMAEKYLVLIAEHEQSLQLSALQRLASYLRLLAEPNGTSNTWVARLPASMTAVAARLGITKETMSRLLRELSQRDLITVGRREIEVRDLTALARVAG